MPQGISFGGLASGLDTNSIVTQLMALERQPRVRLQQQESQALARQKALQEVLTKLKSVSTAAADLRSPLLFADTQTVESSEPLKVAVSRTAMAGPGGHTLAVSQLARAEQRTYTFTQSASATELHVGGQTISLAANADLQAVVDTVNSTSTSPVYAAAVDGKLVLTSKTTGLAGGFDVTGTTAQIAQTGVLAGQDAAYELNGVAGTSSTNVLTSAIPGLTVTLKAITASPVSISIGAPAPDNAKVKEKVQAFVDSYNSAVDFIRGKLTEQRVRNPTTEADRNKGLLQGDTMLGGLLQQLRASIGDTIAGAPSTALDQFSDLGISTGAAAGASAYSRDAVAGRLAFDTAKFDALIASNPSGVRQLLGATSGIDGFAQRFSSLLDPATQAGGLLDGRIDASTSQVERVRDAIAGMDERLKLKEARLRAQFTALETAMSQSQSQSQWLAGQLAGLMGS